MADFTAVIQRAVDGLSDKSPEMRAKVYEKAKTAVQRQLNAMNPAPSEETMARQMEKLDAAIAAIEADFATDDAAAAVASDAAPLEAPQDEPLAQAVPPETEPEAEEEAPHPATPEEGQEEEPEPPHAEEPSAEPEETAEPSEPAIEEPPHAEADTSDETQSEPAEAAEEPADIAETAETEEYPAEEETTDAPEAAEAEEALAEPDHVEDADTAVEHDVPKVEPHWAPESAAEPEAPAASEHDLLWEEENRRHEAEVEQEPEQTWEEPQATDPLERAVEDHAGVPTFEPQEPAFEEELPEDSDFTAEDRQALEANEWELPSIDDGPEYGDDLDDHLDEAETAEDDIVTASLNEPAFVAADVSEPVLDEPEEYEAPTPEPSSERPDIDHIIANLEEKPTTSDGFGGLIRTAVIGILALVVVAGLGFAGWQYRTEIASLFNSTPTDVAVTDNGGDDGPVSGDETTPTPATDTEEATAEPGLDKFTQRLMPDGTEVEGEAGPAATGDAEGKSVAQLEGGSDATGTDQQNATATPAGAEKMFLYEERLGQASPTALEGSIVWSRQMESQDVGNPQPVIQAKIDIPERSLSAMLTIKRNLDPSLPASHIVELVFSLPDNFEGGGIDSVVRISMKQNEQDQGQPLIGVPAAITDYFHMIALNSLPEAEATNLRLLKTLDWIDIPLVYGNGRRALMALEKGPDGKAVFDQVMREWEQASSNQ